MTLRRKTYHILEKQQGGKIGFVINMFLIILIVISVLIVILESDSEIATHYAFSLRVAELFAFSIFTIDYILRVWVAPEAKRKKNKTDLQKRLRYMITPMAIIDLLAIMPFFLGFFITDDLLILRALRLFRALKLTRYAHSMNILLSVLRYEATTFFSAFFILSLLIILAATGIHLLEGKMQPEVFGSIPRSLWWATITLTTVGYGDVIPATSAGKLLGGFIAISGITMAALPAGIMASGFTAELNRRRETFQIQVYKCMEDNMLSKTERRKLEVHRRKLGLSQRDARLIINEIGQTTRIDSISQCPHCGSSLHINHPIGEVFVKANHKEK